MEFWHIRGRRQVPQSVFFYQDFFVQLSGELQNQLVNRIIHEITKIVYILTHKNIFIVSHVGAIANFYKKWSSYNTISQQSHSEWDCFEVSF